MSPSRLVFGAWRLLDGGPRPDADQVARLIGTSVDAGDLATVAIAWLLLSGPAGAGARFNEPERLTAMVKALEISLDREQWFVTLEASEDRPVA
ncbi:hypothetical protein [Mesorhizobium sp. B2-4-15]|uniref:hypothetical protein n=1 Tax=Mesorhizobium sp. B2-4-15 TaxID=2589934 RepID=UPI001FEF28E3|nr:hypothetical protein [Mesorhizobium sp. B2-4-15]